MLGKPKFEGGYDQAMRNINFLRAQCSPPKKDEEEEAPHGNSHGGCLRAKQGRKPIQCNIRIVDVNPHTPSLSILSKQVKHNKF